MSRISRNRGFRTRFVYARLRTPMRDRLPGSSTGRVIRVEAPVHGETDYLPWHLREVYLAQTSPGMAEDGPDLFQYKSYADIVEAKLGKNLVDIDSDFVQASPK